jgi:alkylation response protein AidB-like acyl-CoA dehydrogenase
MTVAPRITRSSGAISFGSMGMTKELPLQLMAQKARVIRIYEGHSEVHRMTVARRIPGPVKRG